MPTAVSEQTLVASKTQTSYDLYARKFLSYAYDNQWGATQSYSIIGNILYRRWMDRLPKLIR
jgi:hypothetical protein